MMTAEERRRRYKERHGGVCVDCGARTSLKRIGVPSVRCAWCRHRFDEARSPHGTRSRYAAGCHCQECRDAAAAYMRAYYRRRRAAAAVSPVRPG